MPDSGLLNFSTVMVIPGEYIANFAYDANSQLEYEGYAPYGSATSSNVWTIKKYVYSSNLLSTVRIARNVDWDSRTSHTYS